MPVEVTVAVSTYNSIRYLPHVLEALLKQNLRFRLVFCDNDSRDGTREWLKSRQALEYWQLRGKGLMCGWRVIDSVPHTEDIKKNVTSSRAKLAESTRTEYLFFLDHDVVLPPGGLRDLVEEFKRYPELGALGIPYDFRTHHVMSGALLLRADVARGVDYTADFSCVCRCIAQTLAERGLEIRHWSRGEFARHLRWEF